MKRLGELFVFSENSVQDLKNPENRICAASQIIDVTKKSAYFLCMPKMGLHCSGTDLGPDNRFAFFF